MNDQERNYYNTFVRVRDFGLENAGDFPPDSAAAENFALFASGVAEIESLGALQVSGAPAQAVMDKEIALAELRAEMRAINSTARALAVDTPGIGELFRTPHSNNEQQILAAARAFHDNAGTFSAQFINCGLSKNFLLNLETAITNYSLAVSRKNEALDERVGATANLGAIVKNLLKALRRLRGIIPNIYRDRPAKLAGWMSASHVERRKTSSASAVQTPVL